MTDLSGQMLGRYRIEQQLGAGGMAVVYKALDMNLEREMAIKFIRADSFPPTRLDEILKRFEREAKSLARMSHAHIVKVYDYGEYQAAPYLVMEYLPNGTLKDRMGAPMPYPEAVDLLLPVASALQYAHRHGVLHRDVKPANILLNAEGEPVLGDFGIAKLLETEDGVTLTATGVGIGTPEYIAPEQGMGLQIDARADIYALGVVFYELITGQKPFTADTPMQVVFKHVHEPLPDPRLLVPGLPQAVVAVLNKAMAKDPGNRYSDAGQLVAALEGLVRPQPTQATSIATPSTQSTVILPPTEDKIEAYEQTLISDTVIAPASASVLASAPAKPAPSILKKAALPGGLVLLALLIAAVILLRSGQPGSQVGIIPKVTSPSMSDIIPEQPTPTKRVEPTKPAATAPIEKPAEPSAPVIQPPSGEPLPVAVLVPLSGSVPSFGISARNGSFLAIQEWNARGGVLGRPVRPILADGGCEGDLAAQAAIKLIDDGVRYIIGEVCSNASIPVSDIANERGVLQISPTSTNASLTIYPNGTVKPYIFRACFIDPFQGRVMAKFARSQGYQTAFVMFNAENVYSRGLAENFESQFVENGGKIVGKARYAEGQDNFSTILSEVAASRAEILYLPDYYSVINRVMEQAHQKEVTAVMMGGDGWDSPELNMPAAEGAFYTNHFDPRDGRPIARDFVERYQAEFGTVPDGVAALSYDAANLLLAAIQKAGVDDPAVVKDIMAEFEWDGVSGWIRFDRLHNPLKPAVVMQIREGKVEFVDLVLP
jgi:branched-chain amino acid transport system substrate-binding protein